MSNNAIDGYRMKALRLRNQNLAMKLELSDTYSDRLKIERDELAAQVEVMRKTLDELDTYARGFSVSGVYLSDEIEGGRLLSNSAEALSTTPSEALREIEARVLEEAAEKLVIEGMSHPDAMHLKQLREWAASKRKGDQQ